MGFPATEYLAKNGQGRDFPFYVWLADRPDGPVWRLMDEEFDRWDRETGRHVAFFVDPFQKPEWAEEFLASCHIDPALVAEILDLIPEVRDFYRGRLSRALCDRTRIGYEYLPCALISLRWNAPLCVACFLQDADDLRRLFQLLVQNALASSVNRLVPEPRDPVRARTRALLAELAEQRFHVQIHEFPGRLEAPALGVADRDAPEMFLQRYREITGHENRANFRGKTEAGFGLAKGEASLAVLGDLAREAQALYPLAAALEGSQDRAAGRAPLRTALASLNGALRRIDDLNRRISQAAERAADDEIDRAFRAFARLDRSEDLEERLAKLLGRGIYNSLERESREAIQASETIYLLSERLQRLRLDMTGVLVGYWKAMEREGRRLLREASGRGHDLSFLEEKVRTFLRSEKIEGLSLGDLGFILKSIEMAPPSAPDPVLTCRKAGKLMRKVSEGARNPYTHRDLLQDFERLESARKKAGCNNRNGVLPLLVEALAALGAVALAEAEDEAEEAV